MSHYPSAGKPSSSLSVAPASGLKASAVPPKPRFRSRTGCWTCRRRKVKCDERGRTAEAVAYAGQLEPHLGCKRCEDSGRPCLGYGPSQPSRDISVTPYYHPSYPSTGPGCSAPHPNLPQPHHPHLDHHHFGTMATADASASLHPYSHPHQQHVGLPSGPNPHHALVQAQWPPQHGLPPHQLHHAAYATLQPHSTLLHDRRHSAPGWAAWHASNHASHFEHGHLEAPAVQATAPGPQSQGNSPQSSGASNHGAGVGGLHSRSGSVVYESRPPSADGAYPVAPMPQRGTSFSGASAHVASRVAYCGEPSATYWQHAPVEATHYTPITLGRTHSVPTLRGPLTGSPAGFRREPMLVNSHSAYASPTSTPNSMALHAGHFDLTHSSMRGHGGGPVAFASPNASEEDRPTNSGEGPATPEPWYGQTEELAAMHSRTPLNMGSHGAITEAPHSAESASWILADHPPSPSTGTAPHSPVGKEEGLGQSYTHPRQCMESLDPDYSTASPHFRPTLSTPEPVSTYRMEDPWDSMDFIRSPSKMGIMG